MRTSLTTSIVVTLVLSKEEAAWLHALVQQPDGEFAIEDPSDAYMRKKFSEATKPA